MNKALIIFFIVITMIMPVYPEQKPLTIASWNTLFEPFYKKYSAPAPFTRMPFNERATLFENLMTSMMASVDIFTLQECGSFLVSNILQQKYDITTGIDGYLITAYKKEHYRLIKTESIPSTGRGHGKGFLATILHPSDDIYTRIGVINVHLPFAHARTPEDHRAQLDDLLAIRNYINNNSVINYWFVCGDFNISAHYKQLIEDTLNASSSVGTVLASLAYTVPTAIGHKGLEHIDYIFYTPSTITIHHYATIPPENEAAHTLLTQGYLSGVFTDAGRGHSSDHAMIVLKCLLRPL